MEEVKCPEVEEVAREEEEEIEATVLNPVGKARIDLAMLSFVRILQLEAVEGRLERRRRGRRGAGNPASFRRPRTSPRLKNARLCSVPIASPIWMTPSLETSNGRASEK